MMHFINSFLPPAVVEAFGWMILHSLWQGAVISIILGLMMILTRKFSAKSRYFIAIVAMLFMPVASVWTFFRYYTPVKSIVTVKVPAVKNDIAVSGGKTQTMEKQAAVATQPAAEPGFTDRMRSYRKYFYQHIPLIVTLWMLGMLVFALKFLGGLAYTQRLKHYRVHPVSDEWQQTFNRLAELLNLKKAARILQSTLVKVPMVVGYFKPVVLIPVSAFTGLSPDQLETVILHEMAHIIRRDYLVNILQSVVEIIFFFHPAVWWMSNMVRAEREHCCDDIAIEKSGDSVSFAKALANIQEQVYYNEKLAVAIGGSSKNLIKRIQRLLNQPNMKTNFTEGFTASCIIFAGIFIMMLNTGSARFTAGENMQSKTGQFISDVQGTLDDTVKTVKPEEKTGKTSNEDKLFELEQEKKAAADDRRLAEQEKLRKYAEKAEMAARMREVEAKKARQEAEKALIEAEIKQKEAEMARLKMLKKRQEAESREDKKLLKEVQEEESEMAMREEEARKALEEARKRKEEAKRAEKEVLHASMEAERAREEAEWEDYENMDYEYDEELEEEILEGVEEGLESMDIDAIVDEAVAGASEGIYGIDLNRIVREAVEGVRAGVEMIDAEVIADEILRGIEAAVYGIDFNVIASEVLSGVQIALDEIDINRIVQYHTQGIPDQEGFAGDPEHLDIILMGVGEWNQWRDENQGLVPDLRGASLSEANLVSADLHDALLDNIDLKEAKLDWANLEGASLQHANLKEATFNGARMMRADYSWADMKEVTLNGMLLRNTTFHGTNLKEADLGGTDLRDSDLSDANLGEANLTKADLRGANLRGADLYEAQLEGAKMAGAVTDSNTLLPLGFDPEAEGMVVGE
jgi:beta-lactamase regulating signal transducer with metallopeptidase domain